MLVVQQLLAKQLVYGQGGAFFCAEGGRGQAIQGFEVWTA